MAAVVLVMLAKIYGWAGLAVALVFLCFGIDRVDVASRGSYAFRPLLIPGIVLLWPLVCWRWYRLERLRQGA